MARVNVLGFIFLLLEGGKKSDFQHCSSLFCSGILKKFMVMVMAMSAVKSKFIEGISCRFYLFLYAKYAMLFLTDVMITP